MNTALFLALGNPGSQYERTRHNAGWIVADAIVSLWQDPSIPGDWKLEKKLFAEARKLQHQRYTCFFLKPQTFMNESGKTASAAVRWYLESDPSAEENLEYPEVVVLHDDLDLPLGTYKLQYQSGPKVHNGLNSVRQHLHSEAFWVARIGVDTRNGDRSIPGQAYVLQPMSSDEMSTLKKVARTLAEELQYTVLQ